MKISDVRADSDCSIYKTSELYTKLVETLEDGLHGIEDIGCTVDGDLLYHLSKRQIVYGTRRNITAKLVNRVRIISEGLPIETIALHLNWPMGSWGKTSRYYSF